MPAPFEKKSDERMSVEYLRLLSLFVEYLDKSTLINAFVYLGLLFVGLSPILYLARVIDLYPTVFMTMYGGLGVVLASVWYRRLLKRKFNRYLSDVSRDTLIDNSEFSGYLRNLNERLESQYSKLLGDADEREERTKELQMKILQLQKQNAELLKRIEELEGKKRGSGHDYLY